LFRGSVRDWLDKYLEAILVEHAIFDFAGETERFSKVFGFIADTFEDAAFVKYRDGKPIGALAPAYFEAVTMGVYENYETLDQLNKADVQQRVIAALESADFRAQTGPGANSRPKLMRRIHLLREAVAG
jgi:hypothetical protein